jgi:Zn finger protein HypA/HybF involved in hydrogenase expression
MHEHGLARELLPQLEDIAKSMGLIRVKRLDMTVGTLHGVSSEILIHSFQHVFEGTILQGTEVHIAIVDPGQEFVPPNSSERMTATGWELLVRLRGDE